MQKWISVIAIAFALTMSGCDVLSLLLPNTMTVMLVNPGTLTVDGTLFYDEDESALDLVDDVNGLDNFLREFGEEMSFTLASGETSTFTRSCSDLQAIFIDDANVRVLGVVTSDDDTDPIRQGDDFDCGSTITYTFNYSELGLGLSITTSFGALP